MADLKVLANKNRLQSIAPGFLWELGLCMTHGDTVYAPKNWQDAKTTDPEDYIGAIMRHVMQYASGAGHYDQKTRLHHLAHAAASCMILYWHDRGDKIDPERWCGCGQCSQEASA